MPTELNRISTFTTAAEKRRIQKKAEKCGLSVSKFLLFAALDTLPPPEELQKLWFDFVLQVSLLNKTQTRNALNLEMLRKQNPEVAELKAAIREAKEAAAETKKLVKKLAEKF
jgi:hypothetical protein